MTESWLTSFLGMIVILSCVSGVLVVSAMPAGASSADVIITSVNSSVDQPAPGEPVTITMEVRNPESNSGEIDISFAQIKGAGSLTSYASASDLGTLSPGESTEISFTQTFDEVGGKQLSAEVRVQTPRGAVGIANSPFFIEVTEPADPALSFQSPEEIEPVAGQETEINVTVSNGVMDSLSNVRLSLAGDAQIKNTERVTAALDSGAQSTHTYQVTFPAAGQQTLTATATYRTQNGDRRTITRDIDISVEEPSIDTELTAEPAQMNGSSVIEATLTEYGNVELRDGQIRAVVDGSVVTRTLVPDVPAQESRTVRLTGSDIPSGEVRVVAEYTAANEVRTVETSFQYVPQKPADMTLSGVEVTSRGSMLRVNGEAANVGSSDANSVSVSIEISDGVTPIAPNKEYYIGQIEENEFDTFELTAETAPDVESIPVRINYSAGGEQYSEVVSVDASNPTDASRNFDGESNNGPGEPGGSGGSLFGGVPILGIVVGVVLLTVGFLAYRWRKQ